MNIGSAKIRENVMVPGFFIGIIDTSDFSALCTNFSHTLVGAT